MSMETTAWTQLHTVMNAEHERRPFARDTLRRIGAFARPHRARIARFVALGVATALLAVATPVLAGQVVDTIVSGGSTFLIGLIEPFVGLDRPGVPGVAIRLLPARG
ncbi:ABC transporter ATP-binding protein, partial [Streptomyces sp. NPDC002776]